jgi:hypothetical protein
MWKRVTKSVPGSAHHINGLPCQDASESCLVGDVLICAMSDGAGSAKLSDLGSKIIVEESLRLFREYFCEVEAPEFVVRDLGLVQGKWLVESIRDRLARVAIERNESEQEFAGTLLVAVVTKNKSVFYQVGDGLWCVCKSGVIGAVTWPEQGEFASQTVFVTSSSAIQSIQCETVEGPVDFIVGMTDGLERLSLDLQGRVPYTGFWNPLIAALRQAESIDDFSSKLGDFLSSPRVCERTDDDKTLALIVHENDI